jgi:hypothetical protein
MPALFTAVSSDSPPSDLCTVGLQRTLVNKWITYSKLRNLTLPFQVRHSSWVAMHFLRVEYDFRAFRIPMKPSVCVCVCVCVCV